MARKISKKGVDYWKEKAWDEFSIFIRNRDSLKTTGTTTHCKCITCGRTYKSFGVGCIQAGHFVAGRNNSILIDERFVHGQCHICNRWKRGEFVKYEIEMIKMWGKEAVEEVKARSLEVKPMKAYEWEELYLKYKSLNKQWEVIESYRV